MSLLSKYSESENSLFVVESGLEEGQLITFVELSDIKDEIDRLFSDEQSRLLQQELSGDLVCDGCTI